MLETIVTLVNHNGKSFIKFTQISTCGLSLITNKDQISTKIILYPSAHASNSASHAQKSTGFEIGKRTVHTALYFIGENLLNCVYYWLLLQIP